MGRLFLGLLKAARSQQWSLNNPSFLILRFAIEDGICKLQRSYHGFCDSWMGWATLCSYTYVSTYDSFEGHNKPLAVLLAKLARHSHVHVTFFTGVSAYDRVLREVEKQFLPQGEENLKSLVRYAAFEAQVCVRSLN